MNTIFDVLQTFCILFFDVLHTLNDVKSAFVHTLCRLSFLLIPAVHTDSVLYRLFADLVHTLGRVNVIHCNAAAARPAGAHWSRGGSVMAAGSYTYLGEAEVVGAGPALLGEAAGPPPAAALPGEAGGASAAAAALLGEAVVAAAGLQPSRAKQRRQQPLPSRAKRRQRQLRRRLGAPQRQPPPAAASPSSWRSGPSRQP